LRTALSLTTILGSRRLSERRAEFHSSSSEREPTRCAASSKRIRISYLICGFFLCDNDMKCLMCHAAEDISSPPESGGARGGLNCLGRRCQILLRPLISSFWK
jgi:hypothetical protein